MKNQVQAILASSQTIVLSVSPDLTVTFLEGSPHEALSVPAGPGPAASLVGRPLAEAWPDEHLARDIRRMMVGRVDRVTLRTVILRDGVEHWYRYRMTLVLERPGERSAREGVQGLAPVTATERSGEEETMVVGVSIVSDVKE